MSMVDLDQISRAVGPTAFKIVLADGVSLDISEVVRRVPGKRLVCKAHWQGESVYAKLFFGKDARRYADRDETGVQHLLKASIPSPSLQYRGVAELPSGLVHVLLLSTILDARNAEIEYEEADAAGRHALAIRLVEAVAAHHRASLIQRDMYLKNFLVTDQAIYTLDGDAVTPLPRLGRKRSEKQNLAVLLSKFDVGHLAAESENLLVAYTRIRCGGWNIEGRKLQKLANHYRYLAVRAYADRKVFRQCTDVAVSQNGRYFCAISRREPDAELEQALRRAPDAMIDAENHVMLKQGNTCTVVLTEINQRKVVIKRYNIKSFWHWMGRFWRPSRASDSWANAHRLLMHGIATAQPLALLEERYGPVRGKAYFLAEYIEAPQLADLMVDAMHSQTHKQTVLQAVAELMYRLLLLKIAHGDMKASNILIAGTRPVLMDLDSMHEYSCARRFAASHVRDLRRLLKNWDDQPEIRQWLIEALWKVYGTHPLLVRALNA